MARAPSGMGSATRSFRFRPSARGWASIPISCVARSSARSSRRRSIASPSASESTIPLTPLLTRRCIHSRLASSPPFGPSLRILIAVSLGTGLIGVCRPSGLRLRVACAPARRRRAVRPRVSDAPHLHLAVRLDPRLLSGGRVPPLQISRSSWQLSRRSIGSCWLTQGVQLPLQQLILWAPPPRRPLRSMTPPLSPRRSEGTAPLARARAHARRRGAIPPDGHAAPRRLAVGARRSPRRAPLSRLSTGRGCAMAVSRAARVAPRSRLPRSPRAHDRRGRLVKRALPLWPLAQRLLRRGPIRPHARQPQAGARLRCGPPSAPCRLSLWGTRL